MKMPEINEEYLKYLEELIAAATPGPWVSSPDDCSYGSPITRVGVDPESYADAGCILSVSEWLVAEKPDLELMAASREAVEKLVAEIRRLEAENEYRLGALEKKMGVD